MNDALFTTLNEYKESYNIRLKNHFEEYIDYDELHFIKAEIEKYEICYATADVRYRKIESGSDPHWPNKEFEYCHDLTRNDDYWNFKVMRMIKDYDSPRTNFFDLELCEKLSHSFSKIISFLIKLQDDIMNPILEADNSLAKISTLNWSGTKLELSELIKALIQSNKLNTGMHQNEIFKRFRDFLNVEEFDENDKLRDISERTKTTAVFINKLEISLNNWIKAKD